MRLIDADEIVVRCEAVMEHGCATPDGQHPISVEAVLEVVNELPTANVRETTTWLGSYCPYRCEHCGRYVDSKERFCPSCGRRATNYE